jgi:hypothetical protein
MIDLNTVIPPGSGLQLTIAFNINNRGEILAKSIPVGATPFDDADLGHVVLLVPCEEDRGDCVNVLTTSTAANQGFSSLIPRHQQTARDAIRVWRERFTAHHRASLNSETR